MISRFRYRLPFREPLKMAGRTYTHREGLVLRYGIRHPFRWAEAAPLPGFSSESLDDLLSTSFVDIPPRLPSLRFALDALRDPDADSDTLLPRIPVNALIGSGTPQQMRHAAETAVGRGFTTLKVKIGRSLAEETAFLDGFVSAHPGIRLRLDANASFTLDEALAFLPRFAAYNPEYIEQPVADAGDLMTLARKSDVPIAADESIRNRSDAERLLNDGAVSVFVLKPMMIGYWADTLSILDSAYRKRVGCVITTSMESGIGRRITARFAARYAPLDLAHGLTTGPLLSSDTIVDTDLIRGGFYHPEPLGPIDTTCLVAVP